MVIPNDTGDDMETTPKLPNQDQMVLRGLDRELHTRLQMLALRRWPGQRVPVGVLYNEALRRYLEAEEGAQ
jgi:hypothetical protein